MIKAKDLQSLQSGHRARLRKKFLDGQTPEYEMLELLLTYAIPRRDVRALSRQLYKKYGSIHSVLAAPMESLTANEGIKENTATFFKLIHKITELEYKAVLDSAPIFHNYEKLENYCKILLGGKNVEEFHVLYLDGEYKLIEDELHSTGTVDWAAVYVREIVKRALDLDARNIVMLHNHPTPGVSFSSEDILITQELQSALQKLKIKLYDHLLVSGDIIYSAKNMHLLFDNLK
ncbi:MAG: RadC family protein [Alphaproteobacteria bacterium]|nr:RadC family protein [Alphaproteobacteria bacterium]